MANETAIKYGVLEIKVPSVGRGSPNTNTFLLGRLICTAIILILIIRIIHIRIPVATAIIRTSPGADVRSHGSTVRRTHVEADVEALAAADDRVTHDLDALRRADEPSFRNTIIATRTRAHAQADGATDAHGGPDAAGPLLRLHQNRDGPAPLLVNRGRHLRPEHRRDL